MKEEKKGEKKPSERWTTVMDGFVYENAKRGQGAGGVVERRSGVQSHFLILVRSLAFSS